MNTEDTDIDVADTSGGPPPVFDGNLLASYEAEFYVWGPDGPLDRTPYAGSFALTPAADFVAELARTFEEMGIRPEQCHAEVGHGNLEISVWPYPGQPILPFLSYGGD